ncbi:MAG: DUF5658 family protein [Woeseiaceae bacterium]
MESVAATISERNSVDRRQFGWRTVLYGFTLSRRRCHRREIDNEVIFLDWHHPWLFFLSVGTMLLSCADAFLTLELLNKGMIEANPIMQAAMNQGTEFFISLKLLLTALGIFVLVFVAKAHFLNRFRTGLFLTVFFSAYACLVCYEVVSLLKLM